MALTLKQKILGGAAVAIGGPPVVYGKMYLFKRWKEKRELKKKQLRSNRLQFSKLPRARQRAAIYYKRSQMRDIENIYKAGYKPKNQQGYSRPLNWS